MKSGVLLLALCFWTGLALGQVDSTQNTKITIVYGGNFTKDESLKPGASIFSKDSRQVQFEHQGADLWCDYALLYQKENRLEAIGNVRLKQGDSILMTSGYVEYEGDLKLAKAMEEVRLTNQSMVLTTDTLYFDRTMQESYYNTFGTIVDSVNTLTSEVGKFFMVTKKYQFEDSVRIKNPDYILESNRLDYYTSSKNAYMYGPSRVTGETYMLYCERGFYDTKIEQGYGIKNTEIHYNNRIIEGDSVYFDKATEFASATNNITVTDTLNKGIIRAHYAEVHKAKDSVFATKRAVAINLVDQDSLYIHGDTLMVTGIPEERILRAFRKAKFYKTDLSGKADSIHFEQKTGITRFLREPVLWNLENQMTGDTIYLISDMETEKLDSLKVIQNAFLISEDTVGYRGYNQAKGTDLFGKFEENELRLVDLVGNTEVVYFMYNDEDELIGIDKTVCSKIRLSLSESDIEEITFFTQPDGTIYPDADLPKEERILEGFIWRGEERIRSVDDLFDEEDNNLVLPVIRGVNEPIDRETEQLPDPDIPVSAPPVLKPKTPQIPTRQNPRQ